MKAWAVRRPERQSVDIYVTATPGMAYVLDSTGIPMLQEYGERTGNEVPRFMAVPYEMVGLLLLALTEGEADAPASREALNDAREVRDRMIALVEALATPIGSTQR